MDTRIEDNWATAAAVLRLASQLVDGIQQGLARRGFDDVRPAHGFAFVRVAAGPATTADVAQHLGVTKQAASQLVEQLVNLGYLERRIDPRDGRARLLRLTGRACTQAAEQAAADTVDRWKNELSPQTFATVQAALTTIASPGALRPAW